MENFDKIKNRDIYLDKLISLKDTEPVKIVTGIRRCGKSSLLKLMINYLKKNGILDSQIIEMNFESYDYGSMTERDLYNFVKEKKQNKKLYLLFDEIQHIENWEKAVNAFRVDFDCDIYITGSNSYLLSSEYSTYLSGRYVEIKMYPLSFREFIDFNDIKIESGNNSFNQIILKDQNNIQYDLKTVFNNYLIFGGMPGIIDIGLEQEKVFALLEGIYNTVIVRDILEREKRKNLKLITDNLLLRKIVMFLADNIGNATSATSIGNVLINEGLLKQKASVSTHTIQSYVETLIDSFIFYKIRRYDIKGKEYLRTMGKYYIVDIGLRNYLCGLRNMDRGHILENIAYFELLRRGYDVAIGKIDDVEIDFIATKYNEKVYVQVTESLMSEKTRNRELLPLQKVKDNYKKMILSLDDLETSEDGIELVNVIKWLI